MIHHMQVWSATALVISTLGCLTRQEIEMRARQRAVPKPPAELHDGAAYTDKSSGWSVASSAYFVDATRSAQKKPGMSIPAASALPTSGLAGKNMTVMFTGETASLRIFSPAGEKNFTVKVKRDKNTANFLATPEKSDETIFTIRAFENGIFGLGFTQSFAESLETLKIPEINVFHYYPLTVQPDIHEREFAAYAGEFAAAFSTRKADVNAIRQLRFERQKRVSEIANALHWWPNELPANFPRSAKPQSKFLPAFENLVRKKLLPIDRAQLANNELKTEYDQVLDMFWLERESPK